MRYSLVFAVHAYFGRFCAKEHVMVAGYANFLPLCQVMVAMRRVCLRHCGSYSKLWHSLCPQNG